MWNVIFTVFILSSKLTSYPQWLPTCQSPCFPCFAACMEVQRVVPCGSLDQRRVHIPGMLVDSWHRKCRESTHTVSYVIWCHMMSYAIWPCFLSSLVNGQEVKLFIWGVSRLIFVYCKLLEWSNWTSFQVWCCRASGFLMFYYFLMISCYDYF